MIKWVLIYASVQPLLILVKLSTRPHGAAPVHETTRTTGVSTFISSLVLRNDYIKVHTSSEREIILALNIFCLHFSK